MQNLCPEVLHRSGPHGIRALRPRDLWASQVRQSATLRRPSGSYSFWMMTS